MQLFGKNYATSHQNNVTFQQEHYNHSKKTLQQFREYDSRTEISSWAAKSWEGLPGLLFRWSPPQPMAARPPSRSGRWFTPPDRWPLYDGYTLTTDVLLTRQGVGLILQHVDINAQYRYTPQGQLHCYSSRFSTRVFCNSVTVICIARYKPPASGGPAVAGSPYRKCLHAVRATGKLIPVCRPVSWGKEGGMPSPAPYRTLI